MKIANFDLEQRPLIIAEIGNNHEGSYVLAEEMIGRAAKAGAHAVKFQTIIPEHLVTIQNKKRLQQLERFRLSFEEFKKLKRVAQKEKVLFLSTAFDLESARFLNNLVPAFKVSSGDNNFYPLIEYICSTGKPIVLSAGLVSLSEIKKMRDFIFKKWREKGIKQELAILHCVAQYPTPVHEANLLAVQSLKALKVVVGYSDHTLGIEAAIASVALGARIVEKHFTLDKKYSRFRDHQLSTDPQEFSLMVRKIEEMQAMLGNGKLVSKKGHEDLSSRRSVVAKRDIPKGRRISKQDISWVRPGGGLLPGQEKKILGKITKRPLLQGEMILLNNVRKNNLKR